MINTYLLLGFFAVVVGPWSGALLEAFMAVPFGFLALILLASLSFAVSLNSDYLEEIADGWASECGISVRHESSHVASATLAMHTVLKETTVRLEIHRDSEN